MTNTNNVVLTSPVKKQKIDFSTNSSENIGYERGAKMVKNHYDENQGEVLTHIMSKETIEAILAQPGATGLAILQGIDEMGNAKPVLTAVNAKGNYILNITTVGANGRMTKENAIVATTVISPGKNPPPKEECGWF